MDFVSFTEEYRGYTLAPHARQAIGLPFDFCIRRYTSSMPPLGVSPRAEAVLRPAPLVGTPSDNWFFPARK